MLRRTMKLPGGEVRMSVYARERHMEINIHFSGDGCLVYADVITAAQARELAGNLHHFADLVENLNLEVDRTYPPTLAGPTSSTS